MNHPAVLGPTAAVLALPFGPLGIECTAHHISALRFLSPGHAEMAPTSALAERAAHAVERWLADPHQPHGLPLAAQGTPYQNRVWAEIAAIPHGETRTYGTLAHRLASGPRAIGAACGANPFPLLVPCHRVVAQNGLGGFAGDADGHLIRVKQWLLRNEGVL